jgi:hypothetical protein
MSVAVKLRPEARLNPPSVMLSGAKNPRLQAVPGVDSSLCSA